MKIKLDFVTNSSSTSMIVCIPEGWVIPNDREILEKGDVYEYYYINDEEVEIKLDEARELLENIRSVNDVSYETTYQFHEAEYSSCFSTVLCALPDDIVLDEMNASLGRGVIYAIPKRKLDRWFAQVNLRKIEL